MAVQSADGAAKLVDAFNSLITTLLANYGPAGTLLIILGVVSFFTAWRFVSDWLKERKVNQALAEKEASIKRMASEIRMYRAIFLKDAGWDDAMIDRLLLSNIKDDTTKPKKARRLLRGRSKNG